MKQNHGVVVVVLLLLLSVSQSSARLLEAISSGGAVEENGIINQAALSSDQTVDFSSLMGTSDVEFGCGDEKDEECVKRRMMAEAHLDYIYTQHHKPKP